MYDERSFLLFLPGGRDARCDRRRMETADHLVFEKTCPAVGDLRRSIPGITDVMLTKQLRELEQDGVIKRKVYTQVPPKVEYSLTPLGMTVIPLLDALATGRSSI